MNYSGGGGGGGDDYQSIYPCILIYRNLCTILYDDDDDRFICISEGNYR